MTTPDMVLLIGPKNRSTWSLRAWILFSHYGIPFAEDHIDYNTPEGKKRLNETSPSGWVPVLWHNGFPVWDTLGIAEYLADIFPEYQMWPSDVHARAGARCICAEMHSGFAALRNGMPMLFAEDGKHVTLSDDCKANIARIIEIWTDFRDVFGEGGPFLFGKFSIADAFFAPVVSRFRTYGVELDGPAADYAAMMWELPSMQQWFKGAQAELLEAEK